MGFILKITRGPEAGQSLRFDQPQVTFGRTAENDVVLNDPGVSRRHMTIAQQGGAYVLRDLGSSNGTIVNGQRVEQHALQTGDVVEVGAAAFSFGLDARGGMPARRPRTPPSAPAMADAPRTTQHARPSTPARRSPSVPAAPAAPGVPAVPEAPAVTKPSLTDPMSWPGRNARERFKARKAAQTPAGKLKLWYSTQPPKRQKLVLAGGGLFALFFVLMIFSSLGGDVPLIGTPDYSGETLELTDEITQNEVFGYGLPDVTAQSKRDISFAFRYLGGRATLRYDAAFIDSKSEVEILVNRTRAVGTAPLAIKVWVDNNEIILPRDALTPNDFNFITFTNTRNQGGGPTEPWAVRWVQVIEEPLPAPDPALAAERFRLAEKRWAERDIAPRNMWDACAYFRESRDLLEKLTSMDRPALYDEASARIKECTQKLEQIYRKLHFDALKAEQFGQWDRAKGILQQMLLYFPDEGDPRNRAIKEWLSKYE